MQLDAIFGAIGRVAVRFRWLVVLLWIAAAFAALTQLPALSGVTQNNNAKFLPASAPSEHAAQLAATVTSAGLVLAGTFVVFGVVAGSGSGGSQFRDIAIGLALGILMDTFLVRTLLVPSTVVLLGRWNWWPSRMSRADAGKAWPVPAGQAPPEQAPLELSGPGEPARPARPAEAAVAAEAAEPGRPKGPSAPAPAAAPDDRATAPGAVAQPDPRR